MQQNIKLTYEQQEQLCYLIDEWYLSWKHCIVDYKSGTHSLGIAKEQLKMIICDFNDIAVDK